MENIMKRIKKIAENIPFKVYFHVLRNFNREENKYVMDPFHGLMGSWLSYMNARASVCCCS